MKLMLKRIKTKLSIGVIILLFILVLFIPIQTALVFYHPNTSKVVAYLPIQIDEQFQIVFTHSIHLTDVVEKYEVLDDLTIKQYEIVFEEFGIGMPSGANEGETFVQEDGKYYIKNMNLIFPSINIRNGKVVSKHRLVWGKYAEHLVHFNDYLEPGARYTMKIDRLSLWQSMRGVKISDEK